MQQSIIYTDYKHGCIKTWLLKISYLDIFLFFARERERKWEKGRERKVEAICCALLGSASLPYWTVDILSKYFPSSCERACISFFLAELNFSKTSILSAPESIFHQTIFSARVKLSYSVRHPARRFYISPDIPPRTRKPLRFARACRSMSRARVHCLRGRTSKRARVSSSLC